MKKFFAAVTAAALMLCSTVSAGFIIEKDAQTAMEKNQEAILAALEDMEITNDITYDEFQSMLMSECSYSTDEMYGASFIMQNFRVTRATETKAGSVKAEVILSQDDGEVGFEVKKEIPALGGGTASTGAVTAAEAKKSLEAAFAEMKATNSTTERDVSDTIWDGCPKGAEVTLDSFSLTESTKEQTGKLAIKYTVETDEGESGTYSYTWTIQKLASDSPKQEIEAAKRAINDAWADFDVSNDTTKDDILKMAKAALPSGSNVELEMTDSDISIVKASTTVTGTVSATLRLSCDAEKTAMPLGKTVELVVTENSAKIDEDRSAVSHAISEIAYTNRVTKEQMLETARGAVKNGSTVAWKDNFTKKNATVDEAGEIIGYLVMTLGEETREIRVQEEIPQIVRKMPSNLFSLNRVEWDILAKTNVERAKVGDTLLSMVKPLQEACDIREKEIGESFSHTRPDGTAFKTAVDASFKPSGFGENINQCTPGHNTAEQAMNLWMNSPGHRANILKPEYDYIGVGNDLTSSVQIFAIWKNPITSVTTSAGTMNFEDEDEMVKEYVICRTSDGMESYLPISVEALKKVDGGYQMNLRSNVSVVFTIGGGKTDTAVQPTGGSTPFVDVKAGDYFENAVKWAVDRNITTGTTATTFSPNDTCTRAQILTFLWRAVGAPKATAANPFSDVSLDDYYYDAAIWASEKGMVSGSVFGGDTPCTRSSTVTYLWKNADAPEAAATGKFNDVPQTSEYAGAVAWAVENGVTSGTSENEFSPSEICSRGQIVTFLIRAIGE